MVSQVEDFSSFQVTFLPGNINIHRTIFLFSYFTLYLWQAVDTQFALEDILNTVQERQASMEQRLVNMEHNISTIMRNM